MDEEGVSSSSILHSEETNDRLYPMCFGVSFAFSALRILSMPHDMDAEKISEIRDRMLQGTAQLLGLLVWRIQREWADSEISELLSKLGSARKEVDELKQRRREDAKANEKVVGIFAMQEHSWFSERKKLRQQVGALLNELRVLERKKDQSVSELNERLQEKEVLVQSKEKECEELEKKSEDLEEKLSNAESVAEELRETAKREAQEHSSELWKHKSAYIELVSSQRQLEAEMGRVLRQAENTRKELDSVSEQKKEAVVIIQKLSAEMMKIHKDLEQKDKILSAVLRKLKLDTAEKQMLLQEVKLSKAKRKQAELESERWRTASESRHVRHSLRSILSDRSSSKLEVSSGAKRLHPIAAESSQSGKSKSQTSSLLLEYKQPETRMEQSDFPPISGYYSQEGNAEVAITADVNKCLEGWVRSEAEKYMAVVERRHNIEIDAFVEQMRAKDEKLESSRWRLMSMELESKRLQSHIQGLNHEISQVRQENMKLEALLSDIREKGMNSMREELALMVKPLDWPKNNLHSLPDGLPSGDEAMWSKVQITKNKPREGESDETMTTLVKVHQDLENEEVEESNQSKDVMLSLKSPQYEIGKKLIAMEPLCVSGVESLGSQGAAIVEKVATAVQCSSGKINAFGKMDLHALGVTYKIKRLKQQLLMIERFKAKQDGDRESKCGMQIGMTGFLVLMAFLNKHVDRYQSLQEKADDLCRRMHECNLGSTIGNLSSKRTKAETKSLEQFLEETFQLQRYIVATGQKLMEIQSKIASGFVEAAEEFDGPVSLDIKQLADNITTLFGEVQKGLEVRIARIIGDLEGTLACEGITQFRT